MNEHMLGLLALELLMLVMLTAVWKDLPVMSLAAMGVLFLATASNAVVLFTALELVSACTWVLLHREPIDLSELNDSAACSTADLTSRHVLLNILGSCLLFLGLAIICGTAGTTDLKTIHCESNYAKPDLLGPAVALVFAGLGIRLGLFPFGLHVPNTCSKITNRGATMLFLLPWIAGKVALIRILATISPGLEMECWPVPALLAVVSMGYACLFALSEQNLRRLIAYILIAQGGFMLLGLAAALSQAALPGSAATDCVLFYLLAISPSAIGAFAVMVYLGREDGEINVVDELAGLGRSRPWIAAALTLFLLSLMGVPPLAGFWARLAVLMPTITVALMESSPTSWWFVALILTAGFSTVLITIACARVIVVMYFRLPLATPKTKGGRTAALAIVGCAPLLTIVISLYTKAFAL